MEAGGDIETDSGTDVLVDHSAVRVCVGWLYDERALRREGTAGRPRSRVLGPAPSTIGQMSPGKRTKKAAPAKSLELRASRSIVRLLVEMLEPYRCRVLDLGCGSGGMFVQSSEFVTAHGDKRENLSIYCREFVATAWRFAK